MHYSSPLRICFSYLISIVLLAGRSALGHSHVSNIVVGGVSYGGFDPRRPPPASTVVAAWATQVEEDGWVGANDYGRPDIVCHVSATSALGYVPVNAGYTVHLQWAGWPESHHGPVLTYLAYCGEEFGSCAKLDKSTLEFFTIDRVGLVDPDRTLSQYATAKGIWGSDLLITNNSSFVVEIPSTVAPGYYVLRHEIIALHFARAPALGPQHYPQCFNLHVTGTGQDVPKGAKGSDLYGGASDVAGLTYDIYSDDLEPYEVPGPTLYSAAAPFAQQTPMNIRSTAAAQTGPESTPATRARRITPRHNQM